MKILKKLLLDNWWLKLLSIVLAVFIWFFVVQSTNPTDEHVFSNIKVTFINEDIFDANDQVYSILEKSDIARVTVRAPKSVLNTISASDITATADVSNLADGKIAINYAVNNGAAEAIGDHEYVKLEIEEKVRKYITLRANAIGEVAEGYLCNGVRMDQNMIEIAGPHSAVSAISYAGVNIDLTGASNSLSANMEILLYGMNGKVINNTNVTKQVDYVHVNVDILEIKSANVYISGTSGNPAEGFIYSDNISIIPGTVQIAGEHKYISGINNILITDPIEITGATDDVAKAVDLAMYLPDGVVLVGDQFNGMVTVVAGIEEIGRKTFPVPTDAITVKNVPDGMSASLSTGNIYVSLEGRQADLDALNADDITGSIDVKAWMAANEMDELTDMYYELPVKIDAPDKTEAYGEVVVGLFVHAQL